MTDRWQKFTDVKLTQEVLREIAGYCDEYLVHGVDVEGKSAGIDEELAKISWRVRYDTSDLCRRNRKS